MSIFNSKKKEIYSIVVSVYNEEQGILHFWESLKQELSIVDADFEIIFVNDGSLDSSVQIIKSFKSNSKFTLKRIDFSKNFGHEAAMIAGIDYASGKAIICMDADLQHPPSVIPRMLEQFQLGSEVITMSRTSREDSSWFNSLASKLFYRIINRISPLELDENASDFFLISNNVANVLRADYRERNRFLRGFVQAVGFNRATLYYEAPKREFGESKYSFLKLFKLTFHAIAAFSKAPLYLGLVFGVIFGVFSLFLGAYSAVKYFSEDSIPSGYTTIVMFLSFNFTILFFLIGIIGMYVGYTFEESKKRPIYLVKEVSENKKG